MDCQETLTEFTPGSAATAVTGSGQMITDVDGLGLGLALADGLGLALADGLGLALADGLGLALGEALAEVDALGDGVTDSLGLVLGLGSSVDSSTDS